MMERPHGIGGSDVPAIIGVSPWATANDVWLEKTKHPSWRPKEINDAMRWGTLLEPVLRQAYSQDTGRTVHAPGDKTYWATDRIRYAHLDGVIADEGIWEGKVAFGTWRNWADGVPVYVQAQVQHYLDISGEPWCDVSALFPGPVFQTYRLDSDPATQANIRTATLKFWEKHVLTGVPPAALPPAVQFPRHSTDLLVVADEKAEMLAADLQFTRNAKDLDAIYEEQLKDQLKDLIGGAAGMVGKGWRIRWKANKPAEKTDWKSVAFAYRHLLEQVASDPDAALRLLTDAPPSTILSLYTTVQPVARPFVFEEQPDGQ